MSAKAKKILFITQIGVFGGADGYFVDVIREMKSRGYTVEVMILPHSDETGLKQFCDELDKVKVKYFIRSLMTGSYGKIIHQRSFDIQQRNPDIIHFNQGAPTCNRFEMAAAYKLGIPFCATTHLPTIKAGRTKISFPKTPAALREWAYPWEADAYIVESDKNMELLIANQGIAQDKIHVVHYGLDFDKFYVKEKNHEILSTFEIKPDHFVIGSVGNLNWRKAHHVFIKAAAEMSKMNLTEDIQFVICGMGEREQELKALIKQYGLEGCFHLIGHLEHSLVSQLLSRFDLFCMSSDIEGQPYSILEALLSGTPVVSTAVDGVVDIIEDGENGYLVPKGDYHEMAKKLAKLVEDKTLRERIASNTAGTLDVRYKMFTMIDKTEEIYKKIWQFVPEKSRFKGMGRYFMGRSIDFLWPILWLVEKYVIHPVHKIKIFLFFQMFSTVKKLRQKSCL